MYMPQDIHHFKHTYEKYLNLIESSTDISPKNKEAIKEFCTNLIANQRTLARVCQVLFLLRKFVELLKKDFDTATREDIQKAIVEIENSNWQPSSKRHFKAIIKQFYCWLEQTDVVPEKVRWIRTLSNAKVTKLPEELLTEEEVKNMAEKASNLRDKAFILVLYESGCRIGEILTLRIKHVYEHEHGKYLTVTGKTGMRRVLIVSSAPALGDWLNNHPLKDNPEASLWVNRNYKFEPFTYERAVKVIKDLAKKAGIKKRCHCHLFRHSRASHLAKYFTEAQLNQYFGWQQGSKISSVYVHLSGRDTEKSLLKMYGIATDEDDKETEMKPKVCLRCGQTNSQLNDYCNKCGLPLDKKRIIRLMESSMERKGYDQLLDKLVQNKKLKQVFLDLVRQVAKEELNE